MQKKRRRILSMYFWKVETQIAVLADLKYIVFCGMLL